MLDLQDLRRRSPGTGCSFGLARHRLCLHLDDVIAGYGADVDIDLISAWWSFRSLIAIRSLAEMGYGSPEMFPEVAVLRGFS